MINFFRKLVKHIRAWFGRFGKPDDPRKVATPSDEEKMWDKLASNRCPDCSAKNQLGVVAEGGLSLNIRCFKCNALFWATSERAFGVKRLKKGDRND